MSTALASSRANLSTDGNARPSSFARRRDFVVRAAVCHVIARSGRGFSLPDEVADAYYRDDGVTPHLIRSAVSPTTTATASALVATAVSDFVAGLSGISAAARLIGAGLALDFAGHGAIVVPNIAAGAGDAGRWVAQGSSIPVRQLSIGSTTLIPRKLATISVISQELATATASTVERVVRQVLGEAAALALDTALFSTAAADTERPAGLLAAATPIAATSGGGDDAMFADLAALAAAVAGVAGAGPVMFITAPARAATISLRASPRFAYEVVASSAVEAGTVIAVAPNAFVSAIGTQPTFDLSDEATLHFEDASPAALSTAGSPNTVAAPVMSLWQHGLIALRMILDASWGFRVAGGVAVINSATW